MMNFKDFLLKLSPVLSGGKKILTWIGSKLNLKTIIIIVVVIAILIGGGKLLNVLYKNNDEKIKKIHEQEQILIKERKQIAHELDSLKNVNRLLVDDKNALVEKSNQTDILINHYIDILNKSKGDLNRVKGELEKTAKQIEELKKNPIKRVDDDLIISLRKQFPEKK